MDEAARLSATLNRPAWILARQQTKGRGRRGRAWLQASGNFSATLIFAPGGPIAGFAQRSFVAALALRDALIAVGVSDTALSLKWPNDVLLNGAKVAGILLETHGDKLAIGFGVNLSHAPDLSEVEATSVPPVSLVGETAIATTPEAFLDLLAAAFARHEAAMQSGGFSAIRANWLSHAARLGEVVTARLGPEVIEGIFETVDETGELVLSTARGRQRIAAADVFFTGG